MKSITVHASSVYQVQIGSGLLEKSGLLVSEIKSPCKAAIISDSNVWPLYGARVRDSLLAAGFRIVNYTFPAGEISKNGETYLSILNFLAENKLTRSDIVIALGGGVVGDITGFAAATFLRGIHYIQIPTTLLAMVDSSVGGKTAIDLPVGKNLAGAFYQPSLVVCDIDVLSTLPDCTFRDGCAEVIKYGVLFDEALFCHLEAHGLNFDREETIARCVELKRDVVMEDEFDTGLRQKLNLGHTIGHGVEAQSNFEISHGQAVAIGMAIVSRAASAHGLCDTETASRVCAILEKFSLPENTEYTAAQLYLSALSDKKRSGGTVNLILPERIGCCNIKPTPISELQSFIEAGL